MAFSALVIDDEKLSRSYIRNMLREYAADMAVYEAGSAGEALQLFGQVAPDIVFLDIKMPGTDGFGLLSKVPDRNFELVFITAYNQYAIKAIKEGATDYLLKPIKKEDFRDTLQKVIQKRYRSIELRRRLSEVEAQLAGYLKNIKEQNVIIEQLHQEIEQLQTRNDATSEKLEMLDKLQKNAILTEDDWNSFKDVFDTVHPNFFIILREKYQGLTQAEIRLVALTKLNMSTKEIASMLGISPETVRQTRWRLKKKMNLPDEVNIEDVIAAM